MAIADSDFFLVSSSGGTNYKVTASSLSDFVKGHSQVNTTFRIQDTDLLLVSNSSGVNHKIAAADLKAYVDSYGGSGSSNIQNSDWFLISNSGGTNYKVSASDLADFLYTDTGGGMVPFWVSTTGDEVNAQYLVQNNRGYAIAMGVSGSTWRSTDGETWTSGGRAPIVANDTVQWVTTVNGNFVVHSRFPTEGITAVSTDNGASWRVVSRHFEDKKPPVSYAAATNGGLLMVITKQGNEDNIGTAWTTTDGINWQKKAQVPRRSSGEFVSLAYGAGKWLACTTGKNPYLSISTNNGTSWSFPRPMPSGYAMIDYCYKTGNFLAYGYPSSKPNTAYSEDGGATWQVGSGAAKILRRYQGQAPPTGGDDRGVVTNEGFSTDGGKSWTTLGRVWGDVNSTATNDIFSVGWVFGTWWAGQGPGIGKIPTDTGTGQVGQLQLLDPPVTVVSPPVECVATTLTGSGSGLIVTYFHNPRTNTEQSVMHGNAGTGYKVGDEVQINAGGQDLKLRVTGVW